MKLAKTVARKAAGGCGAGVERFAWNSGGGTRCCGGIESSEQQVAKTYLVYCAVLWGLHGLRTGCFVVQCSDCGVDEWLSGQRSLPRVAELEIISVALPCSWARRGSGALSWWNRKHAPINVAF